MYIQLSPLLLATAAIAAPLIDTKLAATKYIALVRSNYAYAPPVVNERDRPLKQNGTYVDVGLWERRPAIITAPPFTFTLAPGNTNTTYSLVDSVSGRNLAYARGRLTPPVTYSSIAAFILTTTGNSATQVVDRWTITVDARNRTLLGLAQDDGNIVGPSGGKREWSMHGCAMWDGDLCDGYYFYNCADCFGQPVVLEVKPVIG